MAYHKMGHSQIWPREQCANTVLQHLQNVMVVTNTFLSWYFPIFVFSPSAIRFFGQPQVVEPFDRCAQWAHRSNDTVAFFPIFGGALRAAAKNRKKCLMKSFFGQSLDVARNFIFWGVCDSGYVIAHAECALGKDTFVRLRGTCGNHE